MLARLIIPVLALERNGDERSGNLRHSRELVNAERRIVWASSVLRTEIENQISELMHQQIWRKNVCSSRRLFRTQGQRMETREPLPAPERFCEPAWSQKEV